MSTKSVGVPLDQWSGSAATNALHETIKQFNEATGKQTTTLVRLTWAITVLTAVMLIAVLTQIGIALGWIGAR